MANCSFKNKCIIKTAGCDGDVLCTLSRKKQFIGTCKICGRKKITSSINNNLVVCPYCNQPGSFIYERIKAKTCFQEGVKNVNDLRFKVDYHGKVVELHRRCINCACLMGSYPGNDQEIMIKPDEVTGFTDEMNKGIPNVVCVFCHRTFLRERILNLLRERILNPLPRQKYLRHTSTLSQTIRGHT
jgi:hypothetical protein